MVLLRHWVAENPCRPHDRVAVSESLAEDYRRNGWTVTGPWVLEPSPTQGAVSLERDALDYITGGIDREPWVSIYRDAGGGYEGLQAVARAALDHSSGAV